MKKAIIYLSLLLTSLAAYAQDSIASLVLAMPDEIVHGLQASQRDLLVVNPDDTAIVKVSTELYSGMRRTALTDSYIRIETSEVASTQIKLLPLVNNSKIVCVVKTVCGQICDSNISFYTSEWKPIDAEALFPQPGIDWFIKPDADRNSEDFRNAMAALDLSPMKITLAKDKDIATVVYDIKNYLSADDYTLLEPFLTGEPKTLVWNKTSFKVQ